MIETQYQLVLKRFYQLPDAPLGLSTANITQPRGPTSSSLKVGKHQQILP
jgi:hypothetical protein